MKHKCSRKIRILRPWRRVAKCICKKKRGIVWIHSTKSCLSAALDALLRSNYYYRLICFCFVLFLFLFLIYILFHWIRVLCPQTWSNFELFPLPAFSISIKDNSILLKMLVATFFHTTKQITNMIVYIYQRWFNHFNHHEESLV